PGIAEPSTDTPVFGTANRASPAGSESPPVRGRLNAADRKFASTTPAAPVGDVSAAPWTAPAAVGNAAVAATTFGPSSTAGVAAADAAIAGVAVGVLVAPGVDVVVAEGADRSTTDTMSAVTSTDSGTIRIGTRKFRRVATTRWPAPRPPPFSSPPMSE